MQHLALGKLVDFVRGCIAAEEREGAARHLGECPKCRETAKLFADVAAAALEESRYAPPEADVHCAKALFCLQQLASIEFASGAKARLIFDSFSQPEPAGIRRSGRSSRQTVFDTGEVSIDLRQQVQPNAQFVRLTGQVLSKRANGPLAGVRVSLFGGSDVLAEQTTNEFGEFEMAYAPKPSLRLVLASEAVSVDTSSDRLYGL